MAKFEVRKVQSVPNIVSSTSYDTGAKIEPYVWDTRNPPKEDPFFAVPNIVLSGPQTSIKDDRDDTTVFITY
jgi:hypothetical protein